MFEASQPSASRIFAGAPDAPRRYDEFPSNGMPRIAAIDRMFLVNIPHFIYRGARALQEILQELLETTVDDFLTPFSFSLHLRLTFA
jgi:hypothetical protein